MLTSLLIVEVRIRSGEPGDVDRVLRLMRELAEHEGLGEWFTLTSELLRQSCFDLPRRVELVVAETEGRIVGYATCMLQFSPWMGRDYLFLDDLYVSDEVRGLGIGSRLMRHVGALAVARGVGVRWHVEVENQSAQKFYRALGAELKDKLIAYWSTESIIRNDPRAKIESGDSSSPHSTSPYVGGRKPGIRTASRERSPRERTHPFAPASGANVKMTCSSKAVSFRRGEPSRGTRQRLA